MKYSMTCTCGHVMEVEADSRDAAVANMKAMMTADAIAAHFAEKHPGQSIISVEQSNAAIDQMLVPAA